VDRSEQPPCQPLPALCHAHAAVSPQPLPLVAQYCSYTAAVLQVYCRCTAAHLRVLSSTRPRSFAAASAST
jgi:hypothetical protein